MKEGEKLRLKIRGSGNTVEQVASLVGLTRKTLYNYFKQDVLENSIKDLFFEKLKLEFTQIDSLQEQNEELKIHNFKNKGNKNPQTENSHDDLSTVSNLSDSNKMLSQINKILAENNRILIENNLILKSKTTNTTEHELLGIPLAMIPRFVSLLKLIAKAGATGWNTEAEGLAEISNIFYADLYSKKEEGTLRH